MPAPYTSKLKHLRLPERHCRAVLRLANAQTFGMQLQRHSCKDLATVN